LRYGAKAATASPQATDDTCFLPPLNAVHTPTVAVANLQAPPKAKKEYDSACNALNDKKVPSAESHLRKAIQQHPGYTAAWVSLGQVLAAQQKNDEARDACAHASAADATYIPAYLCLADIAARTQNWDDMLKQSTRALDLDPTNDAVAYAMNTAANLNLHKLPEAEKCALRAMEIDRNNSDPRVHFLLAQIYEAKGDPANEAAQLRAYLKFASDPADTAMVKQYLSQLEKQKPQ
jgi:tetratricopeptide (TPR) repeat protein